MGTVVVITPVYATPENDRLGFLEKSIKSVLAQKSERFGLVHIIVDDESESDVSSLVTDFKDTRLRYTRREKQSGELNTASNPLNYGISKCHNGSDGMLTLEEMQNLEAVCYIHSDDLMPDDSLAIRVSTLGKGFVHTAMGFISEHGRLIKVRHGKKADSRNNLKKAAMSRFLFNAHTIMWSPGFLEYQKEFIAANYGQEGIFDTSLRYREDLDMFISAGEAAIAGGFSPIYVPQVTVLYRQHGKRISSSPVEADFLSAQKLRLLEKHVQGFRYAELFNNNFLPYALPGHAGFKSYS